MNDFTKEELEYLYRAVYERPNTVTEQMEDMRNKIQSVIDNYCEHESDGIIWEGNSDNDMPNEYRCKKCGKFYL